MALALGKALDEALRGRLEEYKRYYRQRYEALAEVAAVLDGLPYLLAGSTAAFLRGLEMEPHDIDLLATKEVAYASHERLKAYAQVSLAFRESANYSSHLGIYRVKGTKVEIMGDLLIKAPNVRYAVPVTPLCLARAQGVVLGDHRLSLVPVEDEVIGAVVAEAGKHRDRLPHWLRTQMMDRSYLEARMAEMGIPARLRAKVFREAGTASPLGDGPP